MPIPKEVIDDWGLTPEEAAQLEPILGKPERSEKVKGSILRQQDYTRKTQELADQRKALEAQVAEKERVVAEDAAALGTWKQTADQTMIENQRALEEAKVKAYKLEQKMATVAAQYGVDPKDLGLDDIKTPAPVTPKAPDTSDFDKRYLSRDDADKILKDVKANPFIAAELEDIVDEHRNLFGKGLTRRELVANAIKNNRSLREEWETSNEVAKKRSELQEKAVEERINARVNEERTKILSEHKLPVTRGADTGSPILAMRDDLKLAGTDRNKPQGAGAVDAAVAAFNTGKYAKAETK